MDNATIFTGHIIGEPEVGGPVVIETPTVCFTATWLGTVSNGRELGEAMRLMAELQEERGEK